MRGMVFVAMLGMATSAIPVLASSAGKDVHVKDVTVTCPKQSPAPKPESHVDFSGSGTSGLIFDPAAPGGARPSTSEGNQSIAVDPTTVTLFPTTTGKNDDHDKKPCP